MPQMAEKTEPDALNFVRIAAQRQILGRFQRAGQILLRKHRPKLKCELLQQPRQIDPAVLQRDFREIEPRDLKELVDQVLQPLGLVQREEHAFLRK